MNETAAIPLNAIKTEGSRPKLGRVDLQRITVVSGRFRPIWALGAGLVPNPPGRWVASSPAAARMLHSCLQDVTSSQQTAVALPRDLYLSAERIRSRASRYPHVADLLGRRLTEVLDGGRKRADAAPLLLRLLEKEGPNSAAMLERFESGLERFDALAPAGWVGWKSSLPGADRVNGLSRYSELLLALAFEEWGHRVTGFEPEGAEGKRVDLSVEIEGDEVAVETTSPRPHEDDWIDRAIERLTDALSRVASGLTIEMAGYESLRWDDDSGWVSDAKVGTQALDDLVNEFCRCAESVGTEALPQVVVAPRTDQPVTITVVANDEERPDRTAVFASSSRTGLAPNVTRLVERILDERHHLPVDRPGLVLVDLQMWPDFQFDDFYLGKVAEALARRRCPTFVGTYISNKDGLLERSTLHADEAWTGTRPGERFLADWTRGQRARSPSTGERA